MLEDHRKDRVLKLLNVVSDVRKQDNSGDHPGGEVTVHLTHYVSDEHEDTAAAEHIADDHADCHSDGQQDEAHDNLIKIR